MEDLHPSPTQAICNKCQTAPLQRSHSHLAQNPHWHPYPSPPPWSHLCPLWSQPPLALAAQFQASCSWTKNHIPPTSQAEQPALFGHNPASYPRPDLPFCSVRSPTEPEALGQPTSLLNLDSDPRILGWGLELVLSAADPAHLVSRGCPWFTSPSSSPVITPWRPFPSGPKILDCNDVGTV